jgi:hypothetical protein
MLVTRKNNKCMERIFNIKFHALSIAALLLTASSASAETVALSNLTNTEQAYVSFSVFDVYQSFTTGTYSSGYSIDCISAKLDYVSKSGTLTAIVYTYDASQSTISDRIGTLVGTYTTSISSGDTSVSIDTTGLTLAANTCYCVYIDGTSGGWRGPNSYTNNGLADWSFGEAVSCAYSAWSTATNCYYLELTTTTAIPEPATFAGLTGLGALGLAVFRRRKA